MYLILVVLTIAVACESKPTKTEDTLVLVHAVFRHGDRTPDKTTYTNDPYINETFYPIGRGQLTNAGKKREFELGGLLRKRYDAFLGNIYVPELLNAHSTNFNRTKMSLALVLAGLFPPTGDQIWQKGLNWQPIPYNYEEHGKDEVLSGIYCPNFNKMYGDVYKEQWMQKRIEALRPTLEYLTKYSGLNCTTYVQPFMIYFQLVTQQEMGLKLPAWTSKVFPQPLGKMAGQTYLTMTSNANLRKVIAGFLLQKILKDTKDKISGALVPKERRLFLYSGHEYNVASLLATLDVFEPVVPPYGGCVLIEVHQINGVYGIKIFYENYKTPGKPEQLKLPNCEEFCPIDEFASIVQPYMPAPDYCGTVSDSAENSI